MMLIQDHEGDGKFKINLLTGEKVGFYRCQKTEEGPFLATGRGSTIINGGQKCKEVQTKRRKKKGGEGKIEKKRKLKVKAAGP